MDGESCMMPAGAVDAGDALGDAWNRVAAGLQSRGLSAFRSCEWAELEAINRANLSSWFPLLPKPADLPGQWVGVADPGGAVVAVQGSVLLDCRERSFAARLTDLSAFYDPAAVPADAWCFTASPEARETRGMVAFMSSGWVHPDCRGGDLFHAVGLLNRLAALEAWAPDWLAALVDPGVHRLWTVGRVGPRHLDRFPTVCLHQPGVSRLTLHVLRFDPAEVLAGLRRASGRR